MLKKRIIARLDIKAPNLIHPVRMEGLRVLGDPATFAERYDDQGVDEILYVDTVASLYGRNNLLSLIEHTSERVFCPITVAGGVRSVEDAKALLRAGADKVAVNTAAVAFPHLIDDLVLAIGSQAVVLQVDAKWIGGDRRSDHVIFVDGGRQRGGRSVVEWVEEGVLRGVGEVLLTSIDQQGTGTGFNNALATKLGHGQIGIPLVVSGGMGVVGDGPTAFASGADGIAIGSALHSKMVTVQSIKRAVRDAGIPVREAA
jgi:cyclase